MQVDFIIVIVLMILVGTPIWHQNYKLRQHPLYGYPGFWFKINARLNSTRVKLFLEQTRTEIKSHPFYKSLPEELKQYFMERVLNMHYDVEINTVRVDLTTAERTRLVCDAVHLTFGHPEYRYPSINEVLVMNTGREKSAAFLRKEGLVFAYRSLVEGWNDETDGNSTSYYGWALALYKGITKYDKDDPLLTSLLRNWQREISKLAPNNINAKVRLFRLTGSESAQTIFCLSCEAFCESPQLLRDLHPDIYNLLCHFLRFDPLTLDSFAPQRDQHVAFREQRKKAIPQVFIGGVGICALIILYVQTRYVEVTMWVVVVMVGLLFLLQLGWHRYFKNQKLLALTTMIYRLGISVLIANVFFAVNNNYLVEGTRQLEEYKLVNYSYEAVYTYSRRSNLKQVVKYDLDLELNTDRFNNYPQLLYLETRELPDIHRENTVIYEFQRGLLGLRVRTGIAIAY